MGNKKQGYSMLRSHLHSEVKKLDCLYKAYGIVKDRAEYLRKQFRERYIDEDSREYKELSDELNIAEETEEFLGEEIVNFENSAGLKVIRKNDILDYEEYVKNAIFDLAEKREDYSFYDKYKNDDRLHVLYLNSMPIHNKIFDLLHFQELMKFIEDEKYLNDAQEAQFEFITLDEEEYDKELKEYKIIISCNNDLSFEIFVNGRTEDYYNEKLYTKNYEYSYNFIGTHIKELTRKFNFLKMMKLITTTGIENKKYKLYLK